MVSRAGLYVWGKLAPKTLNLFTNFAPDLYFGRTYMHEKQPKFCPKTPPKISLTLNTNGSNNLDNIRVQYSI